MPNEKITGNPAEKPAEKVSENGVEKPAGRRDGRRGRPQGGHRSEATKENRRDCGQRNRGAAGERSREGWRSWNGGDSRRDWNARRPAAGNAKRAARPSREAKARLLDASDLTRYEIGAGRRPAGAEAK